MATTNRQGPETWEIALLTGILLLAALLRMGWPGLTEFKRDEALLLARALDVAQGAQFHIRGISSSIGFPNTPIGVWLYAVPLLIWKNVYSATLFTGLVNVVAVLGCWWLVRRYWGAPAALTAALMFAVSPWAIFHSRKIWSQNLLAPLVVGWAIGAVLAFIERKNWFILLHLLCLALAVQLHFAAVALVPATLIFLIVFRRRVDWRLLIIGGILAFMTALPFLYYLLFRSGLDRNALASASEGLLRSFNLSPWRFAWLLTTGREIHAPAGPDAFRAFLATVPDLTFVHLLWTGLLLGGVVYLGREAWLYQGQGDRPAEAGFIVLVWLLIPPLFFTIPWLPVELHYLLPIYPAQYITAGIAFGVLVARSGRWRPAAWAVLGVSVGAQVWVWLSLLSFLASHATLGGYGVPIQYQLQAAGQARQTLANIDGSEILLAGQSEKPGEDEFAAVYDVLLRDTPHRFVDVSHSAVFPSDAAVAILNQEAVGPAADAYLSAALETSQVPLRIGEGALQIVALPAKADLMPGIEVDPSLLFANWVNLFGYDPPLLQGDGTALWKIYWHPGDNPDPADYHFFNHLMDAAGQRLGQQDAATFSPWQWRSGDTILSFFTLSWPTEFEEKLTMRTGMYVYPSLENVPLLDGAGNPFNDAAEFVFDAPDE